MLTLLDFTPLFNNLLLPTLGSFHELLLVVEIVLKFLIECHSINLPNALVLFLRGPSRSDNLGLDPCSAPASAFLDAVPLDVDLVLVDAALELPFL